MKNVLLLSLSLLFGANLMAQKYSDSTNIIGEGHIGKVVINMDEKKLSSVFDASQIKTTTKSAEGDEYSIIQITLPGESKPAMELETMCMDICVISRITLSSAKFKTVKGIGVGSEIGDLKKVYNISTIVGGEEGIMIYIDEIPQTAFVVTVPGLKTTPGKPVLKSAIPDQTKVQKVYMY